MHTIAVAHLRLPEKTGTYVHAQEQGGEAAAGEPSTSMDVDALMRAIQDKSLILFTLGSSGGNGTTVGTSKPNEALPNERDTHSMRSSSCADGESKIGSEDVRSRSVGGAGAGGDTSTGKDRKRRFKCDIKECDKAFIENWLKTRHMLNVFTYEWPPRFLTKIQEIYNVIKLEYPP
jgi:hypothetical protein